MSEFSQAAHTPKGPSLRGVSEGMGAWVSMAGSITCRLATLPARELKNLKPEDPQTLILRTPGLVDGKYLSMRISIGAEPDEGDAHIRNRERYCGSRFFPRDAHYSGGKGCRRAQYDVGVPTHGRVPGLAKGGAEVTHFNGKSLEKRDLKSCPAIKDAHACAVLLNVGDHAMFTIDFRAGGPRVTHDFEALELLEHVVVPCIPYDSKATAPYEQLPPEAADRDEVCEVRGRIDQGAVEAWYRDHKTKGEMAYIASHYGEARAQMIGDGYRAMGETMKALASMGRDTRGPNVG